MKRLKKSTYFILLVFAFVLCTSFYIKTETLQIRIYTTTKLNTVSFGVNAGKYKLIGDGVLILEPNISNHIKFSLKNDSVLILDGEQKLGTFKYVKFSGDALSELKIKIINPDRKTRLYQNNISCSVVDGNLRLLNEIYLDNYIAGVTEAEAGSRASQEFYKVQSILARTFALAHINKHVTEGFSLCDQVHCQAYYGKPKDLSIFNAIEATKNLVVVDENLNLIVAAFHSNSGGQTANSEDVWGAKTSYLKSINDTFSLKMPNSKWERKMLKEDWLSYLKIKYNYPTDNDEAINLALNFKQDERKVFLECYNSKVPLKNIRNDLQLKSTYFTISELSKDSVLFKGKGYGHGLGMCQEGAMRMCKLGYNYQQVLNFYYKNILLIDLHKLSFFKDE
jgi:stage II sporulation protein D